MATVGNRTGQVSIRAGARSEDEECRPEDGKVENVVRKWAVYEDRVLADRIQSEEIEQHYSKNRQHRRTVREDIPVAKDAYSEETAKAQYERMKQLEEQRRIAENDERIARELQHKLTDAEREELRRKRLHDEVVSNHMRQVRQQPHHNHTRNGGPVVQEQVQGRPQEFARVMQEREARRRREVSQPVGGPSHGADHTRGWRPNQMPAELQRDHPSVRREHSGPEASQPETPTDDYQRLSEAVGGPTLASFQTATYSSQNSHADEDFDEETLEAEDRELAVRLQKEEEERYERKKQQRMLAKERKRLERLIEQSRRQETGGTRYPAAPTSRDEDSDFSDFYIPPDPNMHPEQSRRLQEEQDAELARLMQDQEKKGPKSDDLRARLREIESQDLELARIIQEEENLRAKRRNLKHQQKLLQQQKHASAAREKREVAERIAARAHTPDQTVVSPSSEHSTSSRYPTEPVASRYDENSTPRSQPPAQVVPPSTTVPASSRPAGIPPRSDSYQLSRQESSAGATPTNISRDSDRDNAGVARGPVASARQAKIPISLPGRMMHNTDMGGPRGSAYTVSTDIPSGVGDGRTPRRDMYAERPAAGRGGFSPSSDSRDLSPPGPALPERRYRDEDLSPPTQRRDIPQSRMGHPATAQGVRHTQPAPSHPHSQADMNRGHLLTEANVRGHERVSGRQQQPLQVEVRGQSAANQQSHGGYGRQDSVEGQQRGQHMPPYRGLHPPPYPSNYHMSPGSNEGISSTSPRSADTHYDAPWDMSQLESQLLRDASRNQQSQSIKPRQVSPPGRKEQPVTHRTPSVEGTGGRPLIERNEDGQIVMNIAEMIDPTYPRRQGQRPTDRPPSQNYEAAPADAEITAIAGQRRSGKKQAGKRESCKQQ